MAQYRVPTTSKVLQFFDLKGLLGKVKGIEDIPPDSPSKGDRYIVGDNASGDWTGHAKDIAEWNGSVWEFKTPNSGDFVYVEDIANYRFFVDNDWHSVDYLSDVQEELADDGLFFKKRRFGFNTSVLSSVINVETQETDVGLIDVRRHIVNSESLRDVTQVVDTNAEYFDGTDVVVDNDKNVYYVTSNNVLVKLDKNGNVVTAKNISGLQNNLRTVKLDSDGNIYVGTQNNPIQIIKLDSGFNIVWQKAFDLGANAYTKSMVVDDNYIYVNATVGADAYVMKVAKDGFSAEAVKITIDGTTTMYEYDHNEMTLSADSSYIFIACYPYYSADATYIGTIIKLNKNDLSLVWVKRYGTEYLPFTSILYDSINNCYLITMAPKDSSGRYDPGLIKMDSDGNILNYVRFTATDFEYLTSDIAIVEDGYVLTAAGATGEQGLVKLDFNLNLVKYYSNPSRYLNINTGKENRCYVIGQDGYVAVLDSALTLLASDSEWTDRTSELTTSTYNFSVTNVSATLSTVTPTSSTTSSTISGLTLNFNVIAERTYTDTEELLENLFILDKDGNAKFNGGVKVSSTSLAEEGVIAYTTDDLKGYVNGQWKSLTKQGKYIPETDEVELDIE